MLILRRIKISSAMVVVGAVTVFSLLFFIAVLFFGDNPQESKPKGITSDSTRLKPLTLETPTHPFPAPLGAQNTTPSFDVPSSPDTVSVQDPEPINGGELTVPLFYRISPETIGALSSEQQYAILNLQKEYLKFFEEWNRMPGSDPEMWNQRMKEFHEEMVKQLGSETVDSIVK